MVRAPCCEKMGLKKGSWTPEEDQIMVSHINRFGHGNWRALPKQAGLLRCGKSCRLRWKNYLRPDIKRGNFTREEEDTIINLHETLGNRWSAIAAGLPGRTDNEIKNVWHTHLKKRLNGADKSSSDQERKPKKARSGKAKSTCLASPTQSYSEISSSVSGAASSSNSESKEEYMDSFEGFPEIDESFWSDALTLEDSFNYTTSISEPLDSLNACNGDDMSYWLKVFMESGESQELPAI